MAPRCNWTLPSLSAHHIRALLCARSSDSTAEQGREQDWYLGRVPPALTFQINWRFQSSFVSLCLCLCVCVSVFVSLCLCLCVCVSVCVFQRFDLMLESSTPSITHEHAADHYFIKQMQVCVCVCACTHPTTYRGPPLLLMRIAARGLSFY